VFLILLGIDSAFAFEESFITCVGDMTFFRDKARWKIGMGFVLSAFLLSLIYATDAGLLFLDTVDFYINFVMIIVGKYSNTRLFPCMGLII
jgi:SNF family Na+-dependent transporter